MTGFFAGKLRLNTQVDAHPSGRERLKGRFGGRVISTFDATYYDVIDNEWLASGSRRSPTDHQTSDRHQPMVASPKRMKITGRIHHGMVPKAAFITARASMLRTLLSSDSGPSQPRGAPRTGLPR
jgi:hypothetical protein